MSLINNCAGRHVGRVRRSLLTWSLPRACAALVAVGLPAAASAGMSYTFLEPPFTQEIIGVADQFFGGVAFAPDGDVWVDECSGSGSQLHRYDMQGVGPVVNGTQLKPHTVVPSNAGCGLANHPDGFIYSNSYSGVVQINASTGAATGLLFGAAGNALGIAVNPATNDVIYVASDGTILKAPVGGASSTFSTATTGNFVDGIFFGPDGKLYASNRTASPNYRVTVINPNGSLNRDIQLPSEPDGIAFHVSGGFLITMNTDGTITKVDVSNADAITTFASGGGRNDLSAVGADGCVYTTQDFFTRYDNGVTSGESSVVRICSGFNPPLCGNGTLDVGEDCDLSSPAGAFVCQPGEVCTANCNCELVAVTTTTSTTSSPTTTGPATTTTIPGHFQCYEIKPAAFTGPLVTSQDQFGTLGLTLRYPHRLCAPADKNQEGMDDPVQHITGYSVKAPRFIKQTNQLVRNQFGDLTLDVVRPDLFMVPTAKNLQSQPPPLSLPTIDHFACYKVKRSRGAAKFAPRSVTIGDQFENITLNVLRPMRLCAPSNKNGEDPTAPAHPTHLLCYKAKSSTPFGTIAANITNQFGPDQVQLIHRRELCVPSEKNPGAPTTTTTSTVVPTTVAPTTSTIVTPTTSTSTTTLIGSPGGAFIEDLRSTESR